MGERDFFLVINLKHVALCEFPPVPRSECNPLFKMVETWFGSGLTDSGSVVCRVGPICREWPTFGVAQVCRFFEILFFPLNACSSGYEEILCGLS